MFKRPKIESRLRYFMTSNIFLNMPTVKKRNHNGADEPRAKVPRINGKHVHVHVATYSLL